MFENKKVYVIIPSAGKGSRMKSDIPKQYMMIDGRTILDITVEKFEKNKYVDGVVVVRGKDDDNFKLERDFSKYKKVSKIIHGGNTRKESVYKGIKSIEECCKEDDIVLIHDGVRPFISQNLINICIENANIFGSCIPVVDVVDTIKKIDDNKKIECTIDRNVLKAAQTPQSFYYETIKSCYEKAMEEDYVFTDDSSILEHYGHSVSFVEGLEKNFKITTYMDFKVAQMIMKNY